MSEAPKPHKKPVAHTAHGPNGGMRRRDFLKIAGKAALVGLGVSLFAGSGIGSIGIGKVHAAENKKKPVILAQAESNPAVRKELNSLQKVSINEMIQIENASEKKFQPSIADEPNLYGMIIKIPVPGKNWGIIASAHIGQYSTGYTSSGGIKILDKNGKEAVYHIEFAKLSVLYKEATGDELKRVKVLGEYGTENGSDYVNIHFVPIDAPNGKVKTGTPAIVRSYYEDVVSKDSYYLIA